MTFNGQGALQSEANTFWYMSVPMLDYMLRIFRLTPIDMLYLRRDDFGSIHQTDSEKQTGYVSVLCRASDTVADDPFMAEVSNIAWEYLRNTDWKMADEQPFSSIQRR